MRVSTGKLFEFHQAQLLACNPVALFFWDAFHFEAKCDIAKCRAPRKELREVLKNNAAIHAAAGHRFAADADLAGDRRKKAGDDVEQRGLAATRRTDDADEFGRADLETDIPYARHFAAWRVIHKADITNFNWDHCLPLLTLCYTHHAPPLHGCALD